MSLITATVGCGWLIRIQRDSHTWDNDAADQPPAGEAALSRSWSPEDGDSLQGTLPPLSDMLTCSEAWGGTRWGSDGSW